VVELRLLLGKVPLVTLSGVVACVCLLKWGKACIVGVGINAFGTTIRMKERGIRATGVAFKYSSMMHTIVITVVGLTVLSVVSVGATYQRNSLRP